MGTQYRRFGRNQPKFLKNANQCHDIASKFIYKKYATEPVNTTKSIGSNQSVRMDHDQSTANEKRAAARPPLVSNNGSG